jgi:hypothetical protein
MRLPKDKLKKVADTSVLILAFVIPSGFYFLDLAVLAVIGICRLLHGNLSERAPQLKEPRIFIPICFYLYICAGVFFSHNTSEALSSLSEKLPYLLYPLIIGTAPGKDRELLTRALRIFVISVCISMAEALLFAGADTLITHTATIQLGESIYNKFSWYGLTRVFDNWHPTCVSVFCNLAIAILLHYAINGQRSFFRKYSYLLSALVFLSICVFLLYSLTEIIVYGCLLVYFGYRWILRRRLPLSVNLAAGLGLVVLLAGILYANPMAMDKIKKLREKGWHASDNQDERNVLTIRLAKWETHLDIFREHPLFGTTVGDIRDVRKKAYIAKGFKDLAAYNYNAHNEYIEVLATYGLVGGLLFVAILWTAGSLAGSNPLLIPFLIIILIAFMTESILERQQGVNFFLFFYSLLTLSGPSGDGTHLRVLRH